MASKGKYDHQQIERYLQKKMSSAEMHAFEKDMMNDPLLADALEGYRDSNKTLSRQHLAEIADRIKTVKEDKAVIHKSRGKWLRIAALLIIIAGAGLVTYNILNKPPDNKPIAATGNTPLVLPVDSIRSSDLASEHQETFAQKPSQNSTSASSPLIKQQPPAEVTETESVAAAAPLALRSTEVAADSILMANADVHVQSEGLTKERNVTTAKALKNERLYEAGVTGKTSSAQPKGGWVKLQAYIDKEIDLAKEKNKALTGMKVELEFSVDKNGSVTDVKILSTSNTEVAKIALDILRRSPRWISLADNPRATIVLNF